MGKRRKLESATIQGVCVECGDRPQQSIGGGRYRALCSTCHRGGEMQRASTRKQIDELLAFIREIKASAGCSRCPESHPAALDFHHLDPTQKDFSLSSIHTRKWSRERIRAEIAKCVILCANCHRKEHWRD